ncbi:hypothetical protein DICVIV_04224 [Dictyocaulus viviparus]|uniref:Uncharacterized protein n=1 Tax=Dictyocaulus viviparus TaxID=29172 RepID=A0A0D8Y0N8_DICVI|nr:hypothetical protein DICVIV_04224 [Dictyocaulus viviparus]
MNFNTATLNSPEKLLKRCATKEIVVPPTCRYNGWSMVIYTTRRVHIITSILSLILCFIASFTLVSRAVHFEVEIGAVRSRLTQLIELLKEIGTEGEVLAKIAIDPKLCPSEVHFHPNQIDNKNKEILASIVSTYLKETNDATTRISSMLLVLVTFFVLFHLWLTAFHTSTLNRKSSLFEANNRVQRDYRLLYGLWTISNEESLQIFMSLAIK